jgi:hypothetical protein
MTGDDVVDTTAVQKNTLAHEHVHELWESGFRSPRNELFYELAFDNILRKIQPPPGSVFGRRRALEGDRRRAAPYAPDEHPVAHRGL